MKNIKYFIIAAVTGLLIGCSASLPPSELVSARQSYQKASEGHAAKLVPAELHKAQVALAAAEKSFLDDPSSFQTIDLAYIADRKAKMAEGLGNNASEKLAAEKSNKEYQTAQTQIIADSKTKLAASEKDAALKATQLAAEQKALKEAEASLLEAQEEARGLVITLSGSVVFASNKSVLLPAAQTKLDQVTKALLTKKDRTLVIEGHTDSQGSNASNQVLSQQRADAVRTYMISRGYPSNLVVAKGIGEDRPISDNTSAEGRANNRRVEIIVQR